MPDYTSAFIPVPRSPVSMRTVFIGIMALIIAVFVYSNVNIIMTALGFQTTTTLKSELTKSEANVGVLKDVNAKNAASLDIERKNSAEVNSQIARVSESKARAQQKVFDINVRKAEISAPIIETVNQKVVETATTITLPKAEIDKLSEANIDQIQQAFDELFPSKPV